MARYQTPRSQDPAPTSVRQITMTPSVDELSEDLSHVLHTPTIAFGTPIVKFIESCLRLQHDGIPFVITGIPLDDDESPFSINEDWLLKLIGEYTYRRVLKWR